MVLIKLPVFNIQYYEHEKKIDFPVELYRIPFRVDGLFSPLISNRFSLGYLDNFRRRQDTKEHLFDLGLGIEFDKTNDEIYTIKNLSKSHVYYMHKNCEEQNRVEPDIRKPIINLKPLIQHKFLPKKLGKVYDDCSVRISFGKQFYKSDEMGYISPCWIEMTLIKIVDVNV